MTRSSNLSFGIATSQEQQEAALRLVCRAYRRAGLILMNRSQMHATPYHALSTTEVLVACENDVVVCTLSVVGDGLLGLPLEDAYAAEVRRLRASGCRLVEVSCLASELGYAVSVLVRLMALAAQVARLRGAHQVLIGVHPRHTRFYRRLFSFDPIGEQRTHSATGGQPVVGMAMDMHNMAAEHPQAYERLFGEPFDRKILCRT